MDILGIDLSLFDDNYKTKEPEIEFLVIHLKTVLWRTFKFVFF